MYLKVYIKYKKQENEKKVLGCGFPVLEGHMAYALLLSLIETCSTAPWKYFTPWKIIVAIVNGIVKIYRGTNLQVLVVDYGIKIYRKAQQSDAIWYGIKQ